MRSDVGKKGESQLKSWNMQKIKAKKLRINKAMRLIALENQKGLIDLWGKVEVMEDNR
jgi:hypothetical protein